MIEKTIHYCWFGGNPLPSIASKCIKSWKRYCPDYKIVRWDESNFDIHCNKWCSIMYEQKRWAFLSDYARLRIIYENGGIYLDTDVELVKSLDSVLDDECFMGLDTTQMVANGLGFGAERHHSIIRDNMLEYENVTDFYHPELNSHITTRLLQPYGLDCNSQTVQKLYVGDSMEVPKRKITIYPPEYFCAKHTHTGIITITKNTMAIHHFECSWDTVEGRKKQQERWVKYRKEYNRKIPKLLIRKIIGDHNVEAIKKRVGKKDAL